ncbi:MAG: phosphomannomutase, partial [Steroidobacteraceae bacterium]|nr:phosphomannomutase [Steroidobacteraceae bacterium]
MDLSNCFKAYDVRGRVPAELNPESSYRIGRAYAEWLKPKRVAVGRDIRLSSAELAGALRRGLTDGGVDVVDIGLCGTEGVYFATFALGLDGGIMVTASHNPADYNGMKFVRELSKPISGDTGLQDIRKLAEAGVFAEVSNKGAVFAEDISTRYREHLLSYVDRARLTPLKIVSNPGNGGAGLVIDLLESALPFQFIKQNHLPDGTFPHGIPNPMLEENRAATSDLVRAAHADLGIAFDGDFDRCFFFDEEGTFIEGYYIVGLLAGMFLEREPGGRIVHDPRLTWNTIEIVKEKGGVPVLCKSGHAFIKQKMREVDGLYGGEMSAHHYFRAFSYCDSGIIPWLVLAQILSITGQPLSALVGERMKRYPASGEINRRLGDEKAAIEAVKNRYVPAALSVDYTDGLSVEFAEWRFNLRSSNTEPLVRLNVESRGSTPLMQD